MAAHAVSLIKRPAPLKRCSIPIAKDSRMIDILLKGRYGGLGQKRSTRPYRDNKSIRQSDGK